MNVGNMSILNISATNISATSFTSPDVQPLLIAGDNVSILNNVINVTNDALLPSNANFSSINTSVLNVSVASISTLNVSNIRPTISQQVIYSLGTNYLMMELRKPLT
jgi:hypothetical protein